MPNPRVLLIPGIAAALLGAALACGGGPSLADQECAPPPDANPCEQCLAEACGQVCRDCVDDAECYGCTSSEDPPEDCFADPEVADLVACVLGTCQAECDETPSRKPRDRVGRGRRGGKKSKRRG